MVGYQCMACHRDVYKRFMMTQDGQPVQADPIEWADAKDMGGYLIVPPCLMPRSALENNLRLNAKWSKADRQAWQECHDRRYQDMGFTALQIAQFQADRMAWQMDKESESG